MPPPPPPQAVLRGLTSREHAMVTHTTLESDLAARQKALADLQVGGLAIGAGGSRAFGDEAAHAPPLLRHPSVTSVTDPPQPTHPPPSIFSPPPPKTQLAGAKVFGGDKAKERRADDLKGEAAQLELSVGAARAEYERLVAINRAELERFGRERRGEYSVMVENFAATQVGGVCMGFAWGLHGVETATWRMRELMVMPPPPPPPPRSPRASACWRCGCSWRGSWGRRPRS
jgi:hypothetical protein